MKRDGMEGWIGALLLALIGGVVGTVSTGPATSNRPKMDAPVAAVAVTADDSVQALLWEDPLLAAHLQREARNKQEEAAGKSKQSTQIPSCEAPKPTGTDSKGGATRLVNDERAVLLGIYMNESFTAEDSEARMGNRIAATAALHRLGYKPAEYRKIFWLDDPFEDGARDLTSIFAYEWWVVDPTRTGKHEVLRQPDELHLPCLVLYYTDSGLKSKNRKAIAAFDELAEMLIKHEKLNTHNGKYNKYTFERKALLRGGSSALKEDWGQRQSPFEATLRMFGIHVPLPHETYVVNASATTDPQLLLSDDLSMQVSPALALRLMREMRLRRVLGSDVNLMSLLVGELDLRGQDPLDESNIIAIIHERDTAYGRALPQALCDAINTLDHERRGSIEHTLNGNREVLRRNIKSIAFAAGLDGNPRGTPRSQQDSRAGQDAKSEWQALDFAIRSLGTSQLDYVYRQLRSMKQELRLDSAGARLRAVVIGATDDWDLRPIIQMVRRHFPGVLILTTDLYARYADPADFKAMRNLLVASHIGLSLDPQIQGDVPAFRTCYQTSIFLGVLQALEAQLPDLPEWNEADLDRVNNVLAGKVSPMGRIYEISRHGPTLLYSAPKGSAASLADSRPSVAGLDPVLPRADDPFYERNTPTLDSVEGYSGFEVALFGALSGMVILVSGMWLRTTHFDNKDATWGFWICFGEFLLVFLVIALIATWNPLDVRILLLAVSSTVIVVFMAWTHYFKEGSSFGEQATSDHLGGRPWVHMHALGSVMLGLVMVVLFGFKVLFSLDLHEPFSWSSGMSVWFPVGIRLIVFMSAVCLLVYYFRYEVFRHRRADDAPAGTWREQIRKGYSLVTWKPPRIGDSGLIDVKSLQSELRDRRTWPATLLRMVVVGIPFGFVGLVLYLSVSPTLSASRGEVAWYADFCAGVLSIIAINFMVLVVWDDARVHTRYIYNLCASASKWPDDQIAKGMKTYGVDLRLLPHLLDIQDLAERTSIVNGRIYWPVCLILLAAIALHPQFDSYPVGLLSIALYGVLVLIAIYAGFMLRRAAEHARNEELRRLSRYIEDPDSATLFGASPGGGAPARPSPTTAELKLQRGTNSEETLQSILGQHGSIHAGHESLALTAAATLLVGPPFFAAEPAPARSRLDLKQVERVMERIREIRSGAFSSWNEDPIVRATVLPALGFFSVQVGTWVTTLVGS